MDIAALSMSMASADLQTQIGTAVMKLSMETVEQVSDGMKQMMELSVTPYIGGNIDISV
ncbi:MAG: YjfB family protein [Lachnospiraceae bacterium]|nr:YjfB family protein [Lachnospiraceae bacterium]